MRSSSSRFIPRFESSQHASPAGIDHGGDPFDRDTRFGNVGGQHDFAAFHRHKHRLLLLQRHVAVQFHHCDILLAPQSMPIRSPVRRISPTPGRNTSTSPRYVRQNVFASGAACM